VPIVRRDGYRLWVGGPVPRGSAATTIGSLILVRRGYEDDGHLLRHELVHVEQYRRFGHVGFLARYLAAYVLWRARGHGHWAAYLRIPFEVEAEWRARRSSVGDTGGPDTVS
jgi:hypothetical protein